MAYIISAQGVLFDTLDLLSADVGRHFRAISAPGQGAADSGSLRRFEFDQVQGLSLPSPQ
jgi:hypothetical protein